jgi:ABC-type multidrug transport system fused ATPase/permease subunit
MNAVTYFITYRISAEKRLMAAGYKWQTYDKQMSRVAVDWIELVGKRRPRIFAVLRAVFPHTVGLRGYLTLVVGFGLMSATAEAATLLLLVPLYDLVAGRAQTQLLSGTWAGAALSALYALPPNDRVRWIVSLILACVLIREALAYANALICVRVQYRLQGRLRDVVLYRALIMKLGEFHAIASMNHYHMLVTFSQAAADFAFAAARLVVPAILFVVYALSLLYLSPELTLIVAGVGLVALTAAHLVLRKLRAWAAHSAAVIAATNRFAMELLAAMRAIRLMGRERDFGERQTRRFDEWQKIALRTAAYHHALSPLNQLSATLALFGVVVVGASFSAVESVDWLQFVLMFVLVMARMSGPISQINALRAEMASRAAGAAFALEFIRERPEGRLPESTRALPLAGDIEIDGLRFRYGPDEPEVLRGVDMRIPKGAVIALVGRSGAGKSTLLDLLCRLAEPTGGAIRCAGRDIAAIPAHEWRAGIAVVSQTPFLFDASLRENIRICQPDATDAQVDAAADLANMKEFVATMPLGLDTWVGERGTLLSGGQAQRVAIARAILADPQLLILDEATSSQDSESEAAIQTAIERLAAKRTVVIVAHRLATVMKADSIYVMEDGRIAETGTHRELIARGGLYRRLVELQDLGAGLRSA